MACGSRAWHCCQARPVVTSGICDNQAWHGMRAQHGSQARARAAAVPCLQALTIPLSISTASFPAEPLSVKPWQLTVDSRLASKTLPSFHVSAVYHFVPRAGLLHCVPCCAAAARSMKAAITRSPCPASHPVASPLPPCPSPSCPVHT